MPIYPKVLDMSVLYGFSPKNFNGRLSDVNTGDFYHAINGLQSVDRVWYGPLDLGAGGWQSEFLIRDLEA